MVVTMKIHAFAVRNTKELLRDPINLIFCLGFPLILMLLLSLIQSNIPVELFSISMLSPGIAIFGFSFLALFSGFIIAKDRTSALLLRLFLSPMKASDYLLGYILPLLPMALLQITICYITAIFLGLSLRPSILIAIISALPAAFLYIALGLLCGTIFTDKQVGGICGGLLTNLSAWLSGIWFDPALAGGFFSALAKFLPFSHAVNAGRYAYAGEYHKLLPELAVVSLYAILFMAIAIFCFTRQITRHTTIN